nr:hypothetical protein [Candidatus Delongbacteria bacterium]
MPFPARLERQRRNLIGREIRLIDPYRHSGGIRILLCYPNLYPLAMSSLAWQGVYHLFNASPLFECHRSTLEFSVPLGSIETGQNFYDYDIVAFHFSYELDYLNFLDILKNNRIPEYRENRTGRYPLFMAGGLCVTVFPDVIEPFFDVMVQGEAECLIRQIEERIEAGEAVRIRMDRGKILELFSQLDNLWVPAWNSNRGIQRIHKPLDDPPLFTPLSSRERHFRSEFLLEVSRGCPSECSFCAACHLNKPTRFRSRHSLIETLNRFLPDRIRQVGLVGAALAFHPELKNLLNDFLNLNLQAHLSSLRPEIIDHELCRLLDR